MPMGSAASLRLATLAGELRRAGYRVDMAYGGRALKTAMRMADASGALLALVMGDREIEDGTVVVRDLRSGEQNAYPMGDLVPVVGPLLAARAISEPPA